MSAGQGLWRRRVRMLSGAALVAATALVHGMSLVTHNVADLAGITGLAIPDPLRTGGSTP